MKFVTYRHTYFTILTFIFLIMATSGCALNSMVPVGTLNTPEHHVFTGMKLMENGKLSDAEREFNLAKELDNNYASAYRGLGLVYAYNGEFDRALNNMRQAKKLAKSKDEEARVYIGLMRLYTQQKAGDWLADVETHFTKANQILKNIQKDWPDPYFYMGLAYKEAYKFSDAAEQFKKVLEINTSFVDKADHELKLIQKIKRAMPETRIGKKIVLLEKVKRADAAALFIQEMKLDKIYEKIRPEKFDTSFQSPGQRSSAYHIPAPTDVVDHSLRTDIQTVVSLKIKGLSTFPDGTFAPNKYVTRADYAMMIADVISTISKDPALETKYRGNVSPFADVRNNVPYFNAIMVCTTRGIIHPKEGFRQNVFDPMGSVSGVDALLMIKSLREHLKLF
jgi:tetratricopeptide (TPR) repeat protein